MAAELGRYGIWARPDRATTELAREAERLGYGAVWVGGSPGELAAIEPLLDATETLVVATGIINMWQVSADGAAPWFRRPEERHPGRPPRVRAARRGGYPPSGRCPVPPGPSGCPPASSPCGRSRPTRPPPGSIVWRSCARAGSCSGWASGTGRRQPNTAARWPRWWRTW